MSNRLRAAAARNKGTQREHDRGHRRARAVTHSRAVPPSCATFVPAAVRVTRADQPSCRLLLQPRDWPHIGCEPHEGLTGAFAVEAFAVSSTLRRRDLLGGGIHEYEAA
jgi:hypothetical protein